ncbi:small heat shock protein [Chaetomium strumarium]|uniref:Small heat shock protein n=1 Tax=Chaetomium strumarium TaxID=1170767 RepID=A0AAJ0H232_9PEZI|nr:small heat shock protein [Chaetomium strumarium]
MSLFPRGFYDSDPSFTPLFRLLDEFDNYTREARGNGERPRNRGRHSHVSTFNPKFDVRETDNAYELHGELPGIDRDKINIEFTDDQTLVIRGRSERTYTAGNPSAGLVEGGKQSTITEKGEEHAAAAKEANANGNGGEEQGHEKANNNNKAFEKWWVQERSVGEFARTFSFPSRIDQDAVSASLNNGVLSLVVPKARKQETRRIAIN